MLFVFSSRRRHTRLQGDWSSDVCSSDLLLADPATKLILRHAEHETVSIQDLARELAGEGATAVESGAEAVEVTAPGVNKATAVAELGVPPEQVVAFGDFPNDIPLLTWAGHGVAMANAHPDVIAIADEVTAS